MRTKINIFDKNRMANWRFINNLPPYMNAAYKGPTGIKEYRFPTTKSPHASYPNITKDIKDFEQEILQELKDTLKTPFGYLKSLWKMSQNFGTGEPWDTKFMPQFPGRNKDGLPQFAKYNDEIISGNDLSNIFFGHICKFMHIPEIIAKFLARMDACGALEIISKRKLPNKELLQFRDTPSDQAAISHGMKEFDIKKYKIA